MLGIDFYGLESLLDDKQKALCKEVADFVQSKVLPFINPYWERAEFPYDIVQGLKELPIMGGVLEGHGCAHLSPLELGLVFYELAKGDGSIATIFGVHSGLTMGAIGMLGSEKQAEQWLPSLVRLEKIGAFALTEPEHGSDVINLQTTARLEGNEYILNGAKRWIGNASVSGLLIVWAKDGNGEFGGFVIENPTEIKGVEITNIQGKIGMRAVLNAEITFKNVRVPAKNRLQKVRAFSHIANFLKLGRFGVAWEAAGIAAGAYELALTYAKQREQFGKPIASYQLIQEKLVEMATEVTNMQLICFRLASLFESGFLTDGMVSMAKYHNARKARYVTHLAREIAGGNGLLIDNHIARLAMDAEAIYTYEGTNELNLLLVGREITGFNAI